METHIHLKTLDVQTFQKAMGKNTEKIFCGEKKIGVVDTPKLTLCTPLKICSFVIKDAFFDNKMLSIIWQYLYNAAPIVPARKITCAEMCRAEKCCAKRCCAHIIRAERAARISERGKFLQPTMYYQHYRRNDI